MGECQDKEKIDKHIQSKEIDGTPLAYIRGKTIQDILVVEEAQNMTKHEILAILTRLGKNGRIIINGDVEQSDIKETYTGLHYVIDLAKKIDGIECSFIDNEPIKKHESFKGKRMKRGLFKSEKGLLINADLNGALNILRKVIGNFNYDPIKVCSTPSVLTVK